MLQNQKVNPTSNNQGVEYLECTFTDSPTPWCATRVDFSGNVITNRQSVNERCLLINCSKFSRVWCWIIKLFLGGETVTQQAPLAPQVPPNQCNKDFIHLTGFPSILSINSRSPTCITTGGPASGRPCVFPFTYNGRIFAFHDLLKNVSSATQCQCAL